VVILHFSTEPGVIAASGVVRWGISELTSRYDAKRMFRRRTRAVEGVRCRELAQSSVMLIELIMFSAVLMVGIALLVSNSDQEGLSHHNDRAWGVKTTGNRERRAIDRSSILDFCSSSHLHRTISRSICERVSKTLCKTTPKPLHAPKENCSIPTVAFEDVRDKLPAHNRRVLS
jgi:hypothetical protein